MRLVFSLLVLYSSDMEEMQQFYSSHFGIRFDKEQHGNGPEHYSALLGEVLFELYPQGNKPKTQAMLGLAISDFAETRSRLEDITVKGGNDEFGLEYFIVKDPDGNMIYLMEA